MIIRKGTEKDLDSCMKLAKAAGFNMWANSSLGAYAKRDGSIFLVAEENEKVVGFLLTRNVFGECEILVICVKEDYQDQGIGTELLKKLVVQAELEKAFCLFLEVNVNNKRAIRLYEKLGFVIIGKRRKYYDNNDDAFVMRRGIN